MLYQPADGFWKSYSRAFKIECEIRKTSHFQKLVWRENSLFKGLQEPTYFWHFPTFPDIHSVIHYVPPLVKIPKVIRTHFVGIDGTCIKQWQICDDYHNLNCFVMNGKCFYFLCMAKAIK